MENSLRSSLFRVPIFVDLSYINPTFFLLQSGRVMGLRIRVLYPFWMKITTWFQPLVAVRPFMLRESLNQCTKPLRFSNIHMMYALIEMKISTLLNGIQVKPIPLSSIVFKKERGLEEVVAQPFITQIPVFRVIRVPVLLFQHKNIFRTANFFKSFRPHSNTDFANMCFLQ